MIRAFLLCAVAVCALGFDDSPSRFEYAQQARSLKNGVAQLEKDVSRNRTNYTFVEPELHYVLLVGVVLETAFKSDYPPSSDAEIRANLLKVLDTVTPDILEKPKGVVSELYKLVDTTHKDAKSLLKIINDECDVNNLPDTECNRVVDAIVGNDKDLLYSAEVLNAAGAVTKEYLDVQGRLQEVAQNFEVIPHLLQNENAVLHVAKVIINLIDVLYPYKKRDEN